jgi:hypothetical protein
MDMSRSRSLLCSLALVVLAAGCGSRPADQAKPGRTARTMPASIYTQSRPVTQEAQPVHVLVELTEQPTAQKYASQLSGIGGTKLDPLAGTSTDATVAAVQQLAVVQGEQATFAARVAAAQLPATREVYRLQRVYNGIVYATDAAGLARLRAIPGVRSATSCRCSRPTTTSRCPS